MTITNVQGKMIPTPGKGIIRISGFLLIALAALALVFGVLGLARVDITGTIYLEATISDAMLIPEEMEEMNPATGDVTNVSLWTAESWEDLQTALTTARITLADGVAYQTENDAVADALRRAINALELMEVHADTDRNTLLPTGRTIDIYFGFIVIFALFQLVFGISSLKLCSNIKKARLIGLLGVIGVGLTLILFFFTANTLGYDWAWPMLLCVLIPILCLLGAHRNDRHNSTTAIFGVLLLLSLIVLMPMWWIIRSSLMTLPEVGTMSFLPSRWLFSNYILALQDFHFFLYLRNTLIIAVPAVVFGTATAVLCGYSFARFRFRGKSFIFGLCIASMLLPPMVTLIPIFIVWTNFFNVTNSFWPLIIPWLCGGGAFNIFLMRQFILTIPRELDEAAMIDGAGRLRILLQLIVPSIKPAIMVVSIFIFMFIWNDILAQTVYLPDGNMATMALGLRVFSGSFGTIWNLTMVAAVLSIIPGLLIYIFGQKYLIEGIVMTGMKN
ncbi:MAG: carbohydrate ABC transporter permease [Lachnospiraceae bacterium]|nr:carbohydrate ABC transporter permease [Lachnospiraceae bacterium]